MRISNFVAIMDSAEVRLVQKVQQVPEAMKDLKFDSTDCIPDSHVADRGHFGVDNQDIAFHKEALLDSVNRMSDLHQVKPTETQKDLDQSDH